MPTDVSELAQNEVKAQFLLPMRMQEYKMHHLNTKTEVTTFDGFGTLTRV
jgi:hypothetical protein